MTLVRQEEALTVGHGTVIQMENANLNDYAATQSAQERGRERYREKEIGRGLRKIDWPVQSSVAMKIIFFVCVFSSISFRLKLGKSYFKAQKFTNFTLFCLIQFTN